ncbi:sugar phosphate isomerase/epimerase [Candidatus Pelagibacter bacterium]|nr:sugar phosphate isomerase/epimerase [Candidatus Pelagibacter bacterium]
MNLSISNIAWNKSEDNEISKILNTYNINLIDIAPNKYFYPIDKTTNQEIIKVKNFWKQRNIEISCLQSLLYNTQNFNIFSDNDNLNVSPLKYLEKIIKISNQLGAKNIIFGSPKNRDRGTLSDIEVLSQSNFFFRSLGDIALKYNIKICLEPNPPLYNCNFMTNTLETEKIIRIIDHEAIKLNLDIGALTINNENLDEIMVKCHDLIFHVHLSERNLIPLGNSNLDYRKIIDTIGKFKPDITLSIEMLNFKDKSNLENVENTINLIKKNFHI